MSKIPIKSLIQNGQVFYPAVSIDSIDDYDLNSALKSMDRVVEKLDDVLKDSVYDASLSELEKNIINVNYGNSVIDLIARLGQTETVDSSIVSYEQFNSEYRPGYTSNGISNLVTDDYNPPTTINSSLDLIMTITFESEAKLKPGDICCVRGVVNPTTKEDIQVLVLSVSKNKITCVTINYTASSYTSTLGWTMPCSIPSDCIFCFMSSTISDPTNCDIWHDSSINENYCQTFKSYIDYPLDFSNLTPRQINQISKFKFNIGCSFLYGLKTKIFDSISNKILLTSEGIKQNIPDLGTDNILGKYSDPITEDNLFKWVQFPDSQNTIIILAGANLYKYIRRIAFTDSKVNIENAVKFGIPCLYYTTSDGYNFYLMHDQTLTTIGHSNNGFVINTANLKKYVYEPLRIVTENGKTYLEEKSCLTLQNKVDCVKIDKQ